MSFREVAALTEKLNLLGYPAVISIESFRKPNFTLVTELLQWLLKLYDPSCDPIVLKRDISTEESRVAFIVAAARYAVSFLYSNLQATHIHVRMDPKKLYAAAGSAVCELLQLVQLFFEAQKTLSASPDVKIVFSNKKQQTIKNSNILEAAQNTRNLASEITAKCTAIFDALSIENEHKAIRQASITQQIDFKAIEKSLEAGAAGLLSELAATKSLLSNIVNDTMQITSKIEKRKNELDRREKRMQSMQGLRPAYMDEFERHEIEIKKLFKIYVDKHRNLAHFEQLAEENARKEQSCKEERDQTIKRMQQKLEEEELRVLRGDDDGSDGSISSNEKVDTSKGITTRPKAAMSGSRSTKANRIIGSGKTLAIGSVDFDEDVSEISSVDSLDDDSMIREEGSEPDLEKTSNKFHEAELEKELRKAFGGKFEWKPSASLKSKANKSTDEISDLSEDLLDQAEFNNSNRFDSAKQRYIRDFQAQSKAGGFESDDFDDEIRNVSNSSSVLSIEGSQVDADQSKARRGNS